MISHRCLFLMLVRMRLVAVVSGLQIVGGSLPLLDETAFIQLEVNPNGDECLRTGGLRRIRPLDVLANQKECESSLETNGSALECNSAYIPLLKDAALKCVWDIPRGSCMSVRRRPCSHNTDLDYSFSENWDQQADRLWLGPDWFANNAQDWRIRGGRVECINSNPAVAGRTAHLLTQTVPESQWHFSMELTIGMVEPGPLVPRAFAGALIKMGSPSADYRQTALVQMVPGRGGGLLVGLNAAGRLSVRRFSDPVSITHSYWVAAHPSGNGFDFDELPVVAEGTSTLPLSAWPLRLSISYRRGRNLLVQALGADGSFGSVSAKLFNDVATGGVSLFSAYGPSGSSSGFFFDELQLLGTKHRPERAFGPVLGVLYTVATNGDEGLGLEGADATMLRLTAQHPVLGDPHKLELQLSVDSVGGGAPLNGTFWSEDGSWNTRFAVPYSGKTHEDSRYRLLLDGEVVYTGRIRREKSSQETTVMGSLSCTKNAYGRIGWDRDGMMFPFNDVTSSLAKHDPDLLFFAGDQVYDGDITPADLRSPHHTWLDYHTKWQRFLWAFGNLTKDRPTISIPDDHDMFQGNLYGAGGQTNMGHMESFEGHYHIGTAGKAVDQKSEKGEGYCMAADFVNAVSATQVSHLPPSRLSARIGNEGANTYATSFRYGGLDIIVLQDRTWKAGPDTQEPDPPLLGDEQERFLEAWASARGNGSWAKVALSESPFACLTTQWTTREGMVDKDHADIVEVGEYPEHDQVSEAAVAFHSHLRDAMNNDAKDTNGWPPQARTRAVRLLAKAGALHLTGDQHLGVVAQYGADTFTDGSTVFSSPAVASAFPRRWMPTKRGEGRWEGAARYMGGYFDSLGNRLTMLAVSNPVKNDARRKGLPRRHVERSPGYGVVRFRPEGAGTQAEIVLENWPNWADPDNRGEMYEDWPVVLDGRARPKAAGRNRVPLHTSAS